jgi:hypothetical protein
VLIASIPARRAIGSLDRALAYRNRDVVDAFVARYRVSAREGEVIFGDLKRWLWLNALPDAPPLHITSELFIIDEMWHTFVLDTEPYAEYCQSRFGIFIHHRPTSQRQKERHARHRERDPAGFARRLDRERRRQYEFIADKLGERVLRRWYAEYPLRYGRRFFARFGIEVEPLERAVAGRLRMIAAAG